MAVCFLTGKHTQTGNKVSHSNRHTRRKFRVNLQNKRIVLANGESMKVTMSTKAIKTITKDHKKVAKLIKTLGIKVS